MQPFFSDLCKNKSKQMEREKIATIDLHDFNSIPFHIVYMDNDIAILKNISTNMVPDKKERKLKCFMICFCEDGETSIEINSKQYNLKKGLCAVLPPGTIISNGSKERRCNIHIAAISQNFINEILCTNKDTWNVIHYLYNNPISPIDRESSYKIYLYKELLMTLINEAPHAYSKQTRRYHFAGLFCEMMAYISQKVPKEEYIRGNRGHAGSIVHDFISAVNADNGSHRTVAYYADLLCYSPKYLSFTVKQLTGKTPLQIINAHAINQIKYKLKHTDMSMKRMADYFDFPNPSFFGKFVKTHTGMSPMQYRHSEAKK